MLRAETTAPGFAQRPANASTPASNGIGGGFASAYAQLRGEILGQIRHGFAEPSAAAMASASGLKALAAALPGSPAAAAGEAADTGQRRDFLQRIGPWARQAAASLGVSESLVAAHAALESGWGRHSPRTPDGDPSHNLFGIKTGSRWTGTSTDSLTHEFIGGSLQPMMQRFRAYAGYAEAFADYAQLLHSPRYAGVRGSGENAAAFAAGLLRGGYATDPDYAGKLQQVAGQVRQMLAP